MKNRNPRGLVKLSPAAHEAKKSEPAYVKAAAIHPMFPCHYCGAPNADGPDDKYICCGMVIRKSNGEPC